MIIAGNLFELETGKYNLMQEETRKSNSIGSKAKNKTYLRSFIIFGFILILGIGLRFYDLGTESFWLDEVATTIEAQQSIQEILMSGRMDQPPAYYFLMHFWVQIFGISEVSLRSFSALAGVGSIILIFLVGRKLYGIEIGLLSAFFIAISDFQILFSQEARNYSFFEFTALLSFLFFILYLNSNKQFHYILYIVFSIFMVYANAYGICILAAQNLYIFLQIKRYKNVISSWIISQTLILIAIIPYFSPLIFSNNGIESTIAENLSGVLPPSFSNVIRSIYRFIFPPRRYFGEDMGWDSSILITYGVACVFLLTGTLIYAFRQGIRNWLTDFKKTIDSLLEDIDLNNTLLVSIWLLCPLILLFLISKLIMPIYEHRYVISAAPALYILLALGVFLLRKVIPLLVSVGAVLILVIPGLTYYYIADVREQWREVAAFMEANAEKDEVFVFAPNDSSVNTGNQLLAFNYYYQGNLPSCGIGPDELTDIEVWEKLNQCILGHDRFWVIVRQTTFATTNYNRYETFFLAPTQTAFHLVEEEHFHDITAYLFDIVE